MARTPRTALAAGATAVALAAALTACGGGSSSPSSTPATTATTSAAPSASGTAPADPSAAKAQVVKNWEKFFDPSTSLADKTKLLENGQKMTKVVEGFAGDPRVGQVKATVQSVRFTSPSGADVTYSLALKGTTVLPSASGTSVLQDGVWKVSDQTLCALISLDSSGSAIPGC
ncbi:hypothetical protein [Streptomyces sp. ICBB 8177]|uniref:hypothetical protein n=1 Tax=Streptomyces sp. ICBB 8177 TaxID=563922 RepID=UPI000D682501|nr:hypothetical protein [Streptomyces sp. ICBB 8177]PWI41808.1 hypothetical protein CK485_23630 [Streptomyces sp. ICBB 8177]